MKPDSVNNHGMEYTGRKYANLDDYKSFYKKIDHASIDDAFVLSAHNHFFRTSFLFDLVKENGKGSILDIGCHTGVITTSLAKLGCRVVGLDLHPQAIAECKERAKRLNLKDTEYYETAYEEWQSDEKFDYIVIAEIIEHVLDPIHLLEFAEKHCRGMIIVSTPEYEGEFGRHTCTDEGQHIRVYKGNELRDLLASRGELVKVEINNVIQIAYKPNGKNSIGNDSQGDRRGS